MSKVTLNGQVVSDDDLWVYKFFKMSAFSPDIVRQAIANNPPGEALEVEINSVGGSVFAGFEIYSMLLTAPCETVAIVQSLAASSASIIMAGCQKVMVSPVAQVMIHLPSLSVQGNRDDLKQGVKMLDSVTQSILNGYVTHCKGKSDRAQLEKLMQAESWIHAKQAVELGLADGILGVNVDIPSKVVDIFDSIGSGIRALAGNGVESMSADSLIAKYEQLVRDGAEAVPGHPVSPDAPGPGADPPPADDPAQDQQNNDWRDQARLDIELARHTNIF